MENLLFRYAQQFFKLAVISTICINFMTIWLLTIVHTHESETEILVSSF